MVDASIDEACLAVRLYNDPAEPRSFEGFVIHMHLAWLHLFHAELTRDKVDHRYWSKDGRRLVRVDGEPKRWELARCVEHRWSAADPVRANLEFFIALRNKIEHRFARQQEALALAVGGHSQALLLNYESELTSEFGVGRSLATRLRFPVFIGTFTEEGATALTRLRANLPKTLQTFISDYHACLDPSVEQDQRFELRLRVALELAPRHPDALAIQFTRLDDMTQEQKSKVEEMGRTGQVVVREQRRAVLNHGYLKPSQARKDIARQIPFKFTQSDFTLAWKALGVRPPAGAKVPDRTIEKYCVYDSTHGDYVYTPAYVRHLVGRLATAEGFTEVTGRRPPIAPSVRGRGRPDPAGGPTHGPAGPPAA